MARKLIAFTGVALLILAPGCGTDEDPSAPPAETGPPGYHELVLKATQIIQAAYPDTKTTLFTAMGLPASGVAHLESDLTDWTFDAILAHSNEIAELTYANGVFGKPKIVGTGWIGLVFDPLPEGDVSLAQGIRILEKHGYTQGFSSVSMGKPVYFDPQPMYWFCVDRETQGVSSSTGEFFPKLFPCNTGPASQPEPADTTVAAAPDYLELIKEAKGIFERTYPDRATTLFTATGKPTSGVATEPAQLTHWQFLADLEKQDVGQTSRLVCANGVFGEPEIIGGRWFGLVFVPLPQGTLSMTQAIEVLNAHGYTEGFSSVSLGTPMGPDPQPMFWFCVDWKVEGVSASTGDFFPNLFRCASGRVGLP